jgi:branched-subunit amino acid ABC-type transport system permease component
MTDRPARSARRATLIAFGRLALTAALLVALYYAIPVEPGVSGAKLVLRVLVTVATGLLITWLIFRQVSRQLADPQQASLPSLLTALVSGVVFFALADYVTQVSDAGQFADLHTKTDALYFTLATLTTVGYGDVHAVGQLGRVVVILQLVFNVAVITTSASVLTREIGARVRERGSARLPR